MCNYKLINKASSCSKGGIKREGESCTLNNNCTYPNCKEEHICSKVVIDGFDYYVSDSIGKAGDKLYLLIDSLLGKAGDIITVLSTRNGHTDIIKANGDKHWFACSTEYQREWNWKKIIATNNPSIDIPKVVNEVKELALENFDLSLEDWVNGYNKSQETHPYNEEDMIEFWIETHNIIMAQSGKSFTPKELLQIWKEQRTKTIYYE